jgi:hypothetical protein
LCKTVFLNVAYVYAVCKPLLECRAVQDMWIHTIYIRVYMVMWSICGFIRLICECMRVHTIYNVIIECSFIIFSTKKEKKICIYMFTWKSANAAVYRICSMQWLFACMKKYAFKNLKILMQNKAATERQENVVLKIFYSGN